MSDGYEDLKLRLSQKENRMLYLVDARDKIERQLRSDHIRSTYVDQASYSEWHRHATKVYASMTREYRKVKLQVAELRRQAYEKSPRKAGSWKLLRKLYRLVNRRVDFSTLHDGDMRLIEKVRVKVEESGA
jgi:hypothetical protein